VTELFGYRKFTGQRRRRRNDFTLGYDWL